ncbi:MAG: hypothetical protein MZV64_58215 [Ignavibacteriales bacterium]|nr:hypothetical protein [Ignavibacteriales bacterium]
MVIRPWHLKWGATKEELMLELPGDNNVHKPNFNATRGITIHSTLELVWRWIIQIGSKRAGWYSIDWMDNAGIKSSDKILPEFQKIEVGQFIPFTPDQKNGMWVKEFKENEYILWVDKEGKATWLWYLYPIDETRSRLVTRLRTKYNWKGIWIIYYILYDIGDIIMMSKCMKGIKKRAEKEFHNI